jgi:beta-phosphoglucomutase-like phosphatase (HAD superfamily)
MNIIIPIGGKGERFKNKGYIKQKPLIDIFEKNMIFYVLDNLNIYENDTIYIIYNTILEKDDFTQIIKNKYPLINFIPLPKDTSGAAETLYLGLTKIMHIINKSNKNIVLDCDTFYQEDIISIYRNSVYNNALFYSVKENENPIYSYIRIDKYKRVLDIKEKKKISNNANTGAYCFENIEILCKYCKNLLDKNIEFKNEPYTSCVINEMIKENIKFYGIELKDINIVSLGTPQDVEKYVNNAKLLLFDLDGTLVNTDFIYIKIWSELLKPYNINCNKIFFDYFIKGNSDINFIKFIIPSITSDEISKISKKKDELFKLYLDENQVILFDGVIDFFMKYKKNNKIAIITSSNKEAAQYILQSSGLIEYVDLLIASEDCINHKPNPEPYLKAIKHFDMPEKNIFIFEDSFSGHSSAKRTNVKNICLIENENSCSEIIKAREFKFNDYHTLDLNNVTEFYKNIQHNNISNYIEKIKKSINTIPIKSINKNNTDLKTGYICDINSYNIKYTNGNSENIILKISNFDNELSNTAIKLNMYENESYFYSNISHLIVNTPKYFGSFKENKKNAILLEDLNKYSGSFNINLNKNVYLLLNVVKYMHNIHKTFYFETNDDIISQMTDLKKLMKYLILKN